MVSVRTVSLDSFDLPRIDLIKINVEGMEIDVLAGGTNCLGSRRPILLIETIKCDKNALRAALEKLGHIAIKAGMIFLAVHNADKCLAEIRVGKPRTP
jgi:methyltransferase FkbM-like protein